MRHTPQRHQDAANRTVKDNPPQTRKRYSSKEKIRIVLVGLRGEDTIVELCRQAGISQGIKYSWSKEFLETDKRQMAGDTAREAATKGYDQSVAANTDRLSRLETEIGERERSSNSI